VQIAIARFILGILPFITLDSSINFFKFATLIKTE
jgi:hypothetical protein